MDGDTVMGSSLSCLSFLFEVGFLGRGLPLMLLLLLADKIRSLSLRVGLRGSSCDDEVDEVVCRGDRVSFLVLDADVFVAGGLILEIFCRMWKVRSGGEVWLWLGSGLLIDESARVVGVVEPVDVASLRW